MKLTRVLLLCLIVAVAVMPATADTLIFPGVFFDPGSTPPSGSLAVSLSNVGGGVQMVITSSLGTNNGILENLDPGKALYLNVNPSKSLSALSFSLTSYTGLSEAATVLKGTNSFKADGDGFYDLLFTFSPSTKALTNGQSQTYLITTSSGSLDLTDFTHYFSAPGGGQGTYVGAIHVQNTGNGTQSGWVGAAVTTPTPEPASLLLMASGFLSLLGIRKLRK